MQLSFNRKFFEQYRFLLLALPFVAFVLIYGLHFPVSKDEKPFFLCIRNFPIGYTQLSAYSGVTYTVPFPGYFIFQFLWAKIGSYSIAWLRFFNLLCGYITVIFLLKVFEILFKEKFSAKMFFGIAVCMFNPYFFMTSFLLYTDIPALCASVIALFWYIKKRFLYASLAMIAAVFIRQIYIITALFFLFDYILLKKQYKSLLSVSCVFLPFVFFFFVLFAMLPDLHFIGSYIHWPLRTAVNLYSVHVFLISLGAYALVLVLLQGLNARNVMYASACSPLFFTQPFYEMIKVEKAGILFNSVHKLQVGFDSRLVLLLFWILGVYSLITIFFTVRKSGKGLFLVQIYGLGVASLFFWFFCERYVMMILPAVVIVLLQKTRPVTYFQASCVFIAGFLLNIIGFYSFVLKSS